ncbi:MAG: acyl-CoA dehydrogenase family protein [Desulfobacteraceae bacterium]|nr:acyl-CoA dehydrogenase family protein [Desulfobacteraceae bacterium]
MIDAVLTDEQKMFRESIRKFARKEVAEYQKKHPLVDGEFPWDQIKLYNKMGLMGLFIPEEYGGLGGGTTELTIFLEEFSRAGVFLPPLTQFGAQRCIVQFGTKELKSKFLPLIAEGGAICAYAQTEPNAGSDATAMRSTAVLKGDEYRINGTKCFISGATVASIFVVIAKTDTKVAKKALGISAFIVEKGTKGLSIGKIEDKMGAKSSPMADVIFEDCRIPKGNLLVAQGEGFKKLMHSFNSERCGNTAICLGKAEFAFDKALKYSQERETFGKPICQHQGIQWMLAEMATRIKKARLLLYDAVYKETHGRSVAKDAAMAKMNANEDMVKLISDAMQILGGYGYMKEFELEGAYRDARGFAFGGGTPQMLRSRIAYELLKGR